MQRVPFGATELVVSRLGFGTATYAHNGTERRAVERLLNRILDDPSHGMRFAIIENEFGDGECRNPPALPLQEV